MSAGIVLCLGLIAGSFAFSHGGPIPASAASKRPNLQLYADGWDSAYRNPFGAAPSGSKVTLGLRSARAVTAATLYVQTQSGATTRYAMHVSRVNRASEDWSATFTTPGRAQVMSYFFRAQAGKVVDWYGDSDALDGGPGQTYAGEADVLNYGLTIYLRSFHTPNWMRTAVIYQIFPDRFYDGNKANDPQTGTVHGYITVFLHRHWWDAPTDGPVYSNDFFGGDLQGVIDKLPYLHNRLGVNAIYLNPIFEAPSDHKYDTGDFMKIDPEFGTLQTFHTLVAGMKRLGMHLILDGVFEDTGSDSVYFNQYDEYHSLGAYQSKKSPYYSWYTFYNWPTSYNDYLGFTIQPLLNENRSVENYFFRGPNSVAKYWLKQGISGWRLDSADRLSTAYWSGFRAAVKSVNPDAVLIAEPSSWGSDVVSWVSGGLWDGIMNYGFREAVLDFFAQGRGAQTPTGTNASSFMDSEMGLLAQYPRPAIQSSMNLVDSHDTMRILTSLQGNKQALRLVALYQMTWLGAPTVFYGDETGVQGADANLARATFPWQSQDTALEDYYARLIHMRLRYPALTSGSVEPLLASDGRRTVAYLRQSGKQQMVVILNDSNRTQTVAVPAGQISNGATLTDVLHGGSTAVTDGTIHVTVPGLSGKVLLVKATESRR